MDLRASYTSIRHNIRTCDVLLYQGKNWFSRAIRWVIKSPYSHAGIVVWWNDRLMVIEAVAKGVIVTPLSQNLNHYKGPVHLYTAKKSEAPIYRDKMMHFAQAELGKEYAVWKLILFGLKIIFSRNLDKKDELRRSNKLYCSHFVSQVYNAGGCDLKKNKADRFMSPKDIAKSPMLEKVN